MFQVIEPYLVSGIVAAVFGLFAFLVRAYFNRIHDDLSELRQAIHKLDGRFSALQTDMRANTTEVALIKGQLHALWRFVDAQPRASDVSLGG